MNRIALMVIICIVLINDSINRAFARTWKQIYRRPRGYLQGGAE